MCRRGWMGTLRNVIIGVDKRFGCAYKCGVYYYESNVDHVIDYLSTFRCHGYRTFVIV